MARPGRHGNFSVRGYLFSRQRLFLPIARKSLFVELLRSPLAMQQEINDLSDLVTVPQAAKYLGVGRKVVYQLLEYGELRALKQDGKILIDPCSVKHCRSKGIST